MFLASGYRELPPQGALLLYISADGSFPVEPMPEDTGYDLGGVLMAPLREVEPEKKTGKQHCCLFPGDLFPYTRRPTFLILDSDNSLAFSSIPHYFDMPLVVLMSPQVRRTMPHPPPQDVPPTFQDHAHKGGLFTLFLHSPLSGSLPGPHHLPSLLLRHEHRGRAAAPVGQVPRLHPPLHHGGRSAARALPRRRSVLGAGDTDLTPSRPLVPQFPGGRLPTLDAL